MPRALEGFPIPYSDLHHRLLWIWLVSTPKFNPRTFFKNTITIQKPRTDPIESHKSPKQQRNDRKMEYFLNGRHHVVRRRRERSKQNRRQHEFVGRRNTGPFRVTGVTYLIQPYLIQCLFNSAFLKMDISLDQIALIADFMMIPDVLMHSQHFWQGLDCKIA